MDFWISEWISGFQIGFLDFTVDFWISQWISGFQLGFLDFWISVWISADGVRDFFRDGPLGWHRVGHPPALTTWIGLENTTLTLQRAGFWQERLLGL